MVNDSAQIYTIEGIAAGVLMIVTAYLVVSTTTVLTPQDVHIIDMQLQQLGNDALAMMDTPDDYGPTSIRNMSPLTAMIMKNDTDAFEDRFLFYVNSSTNVIGTGDRLDYYATLTYLNETYQIQTVTFGGHPYYRENAVKSTRWVYLPINNTYPYYPYLNMRHDVNQTVLLEVLLWRE